jgi:hypothetical protein
MLLIINNWIHNKNKEGLIRILNYLKWEYKFGDINDIDDNKWKIIYSPSEPLEFDKYPNKLWLFGPHFSIFKTENKFDKINVKQNNLIFIAQSDWFINAIKFTNPNLILNIKLLPFPINIDLFTDSGNNRTEILIYFKHRKIQELQFIVNELNKRDIINFRIFSYDHKYDESDFINYVQMSKYGIIIGGHEKQGFAIEEMMSCNLPLLVWNVNSLNQDEGFNYPDYPSTSIPYWDERCGEVFYNSNEFEMKFKLFIDNLEKYKPREFIKDNLSTEKCAERLQMLINMS